MQQPLAGRRLRAVCQNQDVHPGAGEALSAGQARPANPAPTMTTSAELIKLVRARHGHAERQRPRPPRRAPPQQRSSRQAVLVFTMTSDTRGACSWRIASET